METKIELDVVTNQLQSALDELKRKRLDRNLIHDYITEALSRVKKLNEPAVSKCDSIERRNLLIDFGNQVVEIQNRYHCILQDVEKEVDAYLKSINNC